MAKSKKISIKARQKHKTAHAKITKRKPEKAPTVKKKTVTSKILKKPKQDLEDQSELNRFENLRNATNENLFSTVFNDSDNDNYEQDYEDQLSKQKKPSNRLPIKTAQGTLHQVEEDDVEEEEADFEMEGIEEEEDNNLLTKEITATELLIDHERILQAKKIEVATFSSHILENPNEKLSNFTTLFRMLDNKDLGGFLTLKKLIIVSVQEVFKELLPSYKITQTINTDIKLKKETLRLDKYETSMLQYYKKFLQILERLCTPLFGKQRTLDKATEKLCMIAVNAFCDLLESHPKFNYSENIVQTVVPLLNNYHKDVREKVCATLQIVVKEDKKGETTLNILRLINKTCKKNSYKVRPELLEVVLFLRIKDVNLDSEREQLLKQKKLQSHKGNVLKMSKKEKKRQVRLKEIEKELLEAKAEENKQVKTKFVSEILKISFSILFRMLKTSDNVKIIKLSLQGVSKFAHCINVELYFDLIKILDQLLKNDELDFICKQYCIQTGFKILNEQGDILNLDPVNFYNSLYENLLMIHASKNYKQFEVILETLTYSLVKRHKKNSNSRVLGFMKRVMTLSLQLLHNGTLGCLAVTRTMLQLKGAYDVLLDIESSSGEGCYQPELNSAEYSNAGASALFELALLNKHYHPHVAEFSKYVATGVPITTGNSLSTRYGRCTPEELYNSYDMLTMSFVPSIPIATNAKRKNNYKIEQFCDESFKQECKSLIGCK